MILKKQISIILTFFLLVSNLGLAFNVHYCDNTIESISLSTISATQEAEDTCCGILEKDSNCCKDKVIKSEIKSDLIIVKSLSFETDFLATINEWNSTSFFYNSNFKTKDSFTYYCDTNAPPLYLLYSQYTFYA